MSFVVRGAEAADLPAERADVQFLGSAQTRLDGVRHHLLQRRIGNEEGRDDAGTSRIGAAELERCRRTVGLGVAGIGGQLRRDPVGASDHRVEAVIGIIAVQLAADLVLQLDPRIVEAAAGGDRKRLGHVEGVDRVDPGILIDGAQRDRADRDGIAGLAEKDAAAADDVVRTDGAEFGTCREICDAGGKAPADGETVVMAEQLIGIGRLQLHARGSRLRRGAVVLA